VQNIDMSVTVMGQKLAMPIYCSPTALQRLFHHTGERAVAAAAAKFGTMFGVSSLGTVSLEELRKAHDTPQVYQFYFHRDRGLNRAMMQRAREAGVEVMMLTVDSITGGNRERDLRTGFSIPFRLTPGGMYQFAVKPMWGINYLAHESFKLPQLDQHVDMGGGAMSIGRYFTEMLDPSMNWDDVAEMVKQWKGQFCLKGIMSDADARRAVQIGCTGIVLSNHGGRQLDRAPVPFRLLPEVVREVGKDVEIAIDTGIMSGADIVASIALGAKFTLIGRAYLYGLMAGGREGVDRVIAILRDQIERTMKLLGVATLAELTPGHVTQLARAYPVPSGTAGSPG
jgi:L-lactate dehydrogenase (cytochrome)